MNNNNVNYYVVHNTTVRCDFVLCCLLEIASCSEALSTHDSILSPRVPQEGAVCINMSKRSLQQRLLVHSACILHPHCIACSTLRFQLHAPFG